MTDDEMLERFETTALTYTECDHRMHVRVGFLLLKRDGFDGALRAMRDGLLRLNVRHEVPDALDRGYHETVTEAWLRLIDAAMRGYGAPETFDAFAEKHPHLLQRTLLRLFYRRDTVVSAEAKARFVDADLARLPAS